MRKLIRATKSDCTGTRRKGSLWGTVSIIIPILLAAVMLSACGKRNAGGELVPSASPLYEEEIAYFETELLDKEDGRIANIKLACEAINGKILAPNEVFSFNDVVGERTEERGYREATIILHDERERGIGGGICQVSSTLYNAAVNVGFEITERTEHTKDIGYIELGKDATVSEVIDLKFVNNLPTPAKIQAACDNEKVRIWVYK